MSSGPDVLTTPADIEVEWQRLECGWLESDLDTWRELARRYGDPVVELGCGIGRVALSLAGDGHRVIGVEQSICLGRHLESEALERGLEMTVVLSSATALDRLWGSSLARAGVGDGISLVIGPMSFFNLMSAEQRSLILDSLTSGTGSRPVIALAVLDQPPPPEVGSRQPADLPDFADRSGTVVSSRVVSVSWCHPEITVTRERQSVSATGVLLREFVREQLEWLADDALQDLFKRRGYVLQEQRLLPREPGMMDSRLVVFRPEGRR